MNNTPKISIITIVYNDVIHLENTIQSVVDQSYNNIEYVIIDGNSTDGTVDIIKKYSGQIGYWISEPDKGIYDAMNKGLLAATGDYVLFLNSGDRLYHNEIFQQLFDSKAETLPDVIYGETMIVAEDGAEIGLRRLKAPEQLTWKSLSEGMLVCHQSFLAKRNIAPYYDLNYHYSADYDWMIKVLKNAKSIVNARQIVAAFLDGGTSKKNIRNSLLERFSIMSKNYGFVTTALHHIVIGFRFWVFYLKNKRF